MEVLPPNQTVTSRSARGRERVEPELGKQLASCSYRLYTHNSAGWDMCEEGEGEGDIISAATTLHS